MELLEIGQLRIFERKIDVEQAIIEHGNAGIHSLIEIEYGGNPALCDRSPGIDIRRDKQLALIINLKDIHTCVCSFARVDARGRLVQCYHGAHKKPMKNHTARGSITCPEAN